MQVNGRGMSHDHAGICAGSCMASGSRCALGPYSTLDPPTVIRMEWKHSWVETKMCTSSIMGSFEKSCLGEKKEKKASVFTGGTAN